LVVIGGVAAGLSAASYAKRRRPDMEVTVFEMSPHASYGSCGLPYLIEGLVENPVELIALPLEDLRKKRGLDVRVLHEVTNIDTKERSVTVIDLVTGDEFKAPYDNLVISIGASPVVPPLPGIGIEPDDPVTGGAGKVKQLLDQPVTNPPALVGGQEPQPLELAGAVVQPADGPGADDDAVLQRDEEQALAVEIVLLSLVHVAQFAALIAKPDDFFQRRAPLENPAGDRQDDSFGFRNLVRLEASNLDRG